MNNVNMQFILSLLIIALGYIFKRIGLVKETDGEGISRIIFNITLPSLVITTFSTIVIDRTLLLMPVLSLVFGLIMTVTGLVVFKKEGNKNKGMLSMLVPGFNVGLFAYPLIESVWGKEGLKYISMFDMGNSVIVFGVCYVTASIFSMEGGKVDFRGVLKRAASSIPFMSYIVTLILNLSGLHFPKLMIDITGILSKANMPLSLLLLGIYLSFSFEKEHLVKMAKILGLRYGIGTAVGIILYLVLPVEPLFKNIMLLAFTLPISMSVIPYSVQFDYDKKFVGTINNMTIIISFIYVWAVVAFVLS